MAVRKRNKERISLDRYSSIPLYCEPGKKETFIIQAYTRDNAGNRSNVVSFDYIINRTNVDNLPSELKILSPVPGVLFQLDDL